VIILWVGVTRNEIFDAFDEPQAQVNAARVIRVCARA
jgi:hypothetical protein